MLVLLVVVGAFVVLRELGREELEVEPEVIDYLPVVESVQESGLEVAYPPSLPEGWQTTSVDAGPADDVVFGLGMLTAEDRFAGLRQESTTLEKLVEVYVDENAAAGEPIQAGSGELAGEWRTFTDQDGDTAFGREAPNGTLLVYGSASRDDLLLLLDELTLAPVESTSSS
jgi:hypothetical protein